MIKCLSKIKHAFFICCLMQLIFFPTVSLKAAWTQPPTLISEPSVNTDLTNGACLDVNASNNGVATWVASGPDNVYASSYTFGTGWSIPQVLNSQALNVFDDRIFINMANSQVSLNETNFAAACWQGDELFEDEVDFTYPGIYTSTRSPNGLWAFQQLASAPDSPFEFFPSNPCGAINDAGTFVVVWIERRSDDDINTYYFTMANIQQVGGGWGAPIQLGGPFYNYPNDPTPPDVEINSRGDIIATWKRFLEDGTVAIEASTYNSTTNTWSPTFSLDTTGLNQNTNPQDLPKAGIDEKGNAIVVWPWTDIVTEDRIYSRSFSPVTGWGPAIIIDNSFEDFSFTSSAVMDRFGNSTATWVVDDGSSSSLFASSLPLGGVWSTPVVISTIPGSNFTDGNLVQRNISADLSGNVIVIFENDTEESTNVYSVANFIGLGWQIPELITSDVLFPSQFEPTNLNIGYGSCGFAIALWQAFTGEEGEYLVWASTNFSQASPPCLFTGTQCREKFASQSICVNKLTWGFCNLNCTQFYNLYRNGTLIATIPVNDPHAFNDPVACRTSALYTLTAVNIYGIESPPATLLLP